VPLPVPPELEEALAADPVARAHFDRLPSEGKDAWIAWVSRPRAPWAQRHRTREAVRRLAGVPATEQATRQAPPLLPPRPAWWPWLLALALVALVAALLVWLLAYRNGGGGGRGPTTVVRGSVPELVGLRLPQAKAVARRAGVGLTVDRRRSDRPAGVVVGQKPPAGTAVPNGALVSLLVSSGPGTTSASRSRTTTAATTATTAATTTAGATPATTQQATTQQATTTQQSGVAVPSLVGDGLGAALRALEQAGLLAAVAYQTSQRPVGEVRGQNPAAGERVHPGARVQVNVAEGPEPGNPTRVPDVTGEDESTARTDLERAGFGVVVVSTSRGSEAGVVEQQPRAGVTISSDDLVAIYVHG
jgi:beta-lactam-binding protein with PASTA domain